MKDIVDDIKALAERIRAPSLSFMEVCGTHTMAIWRHGLRSMMPEKIRLLSGPGCPVCVTSPTQIDAAIALARQPETIVATFGDMVRVPGTSSSLERERAGGADVRVVYSPLGALDLARACPGRQVVFLAVGFETTAPLVASLVLQAVAEGIRNLWVFPAHKLIPPALDALLADREVHVDGFLCPGHVSTIIGSQAYEFIPERYGKPCVIAGFEPGDILLSIKMLLQQIAEGRSRVEIEYTRCVKPEGNPKARMCADKVFMPADSEWRGLGVIPKSGLSLRLEFSSFDAQGHFGVRLNPVKEPGGCLCGAVLRGAIFPAQCPLFGKTCTPESPVGPCMVSSEGACAAFYKYGR
jgi:hydrogenase expression/formation protein HypD